MKKIIYILSISLMMMSCNDFLGLNPVDTISPQNYFKTENDINTALAGVYDVLGKTETYGRTMFFELDMSDEGFSNLTTQNNDLSLNDYTAAEGKVANLWAKLYDGINRANLLLENIDNSDLDMAASKKEVAKGQALFLRSYYYFLLVSNWGDVPFRLVSVKSPKDEIHIARTDTKVIYKKILEDMETAFTKVDFITAYKYNSRITKSVVAGILARVNLKMAGYPLQDVSRYAEAKKWALEAMDPIHGHELNPDYKQIFINQCQDKYDIKECLWEVEFGKVATGGQEEEGSVGSINGIGNGDRTFGYSYGAVHVTKYYYNQFEADKDLRRDWTINNYYYGTVGGVANSHVAYSAAQIYNRCNAKWRREYETTLPKNVNTTPINFPILRFSDVLLMFAEADVQSSNSSTPSDEAIEAVNKVRRRGYGLNLTTPPNPTVDADLPDNMDKTDFLIAIQKERSLELGFEALRRFDLIRWGTYVSTMSNLANEIINENPSGYIHAARTARNTSERHLLLPIPENEMSLNNKVKQNPGW